MADANVDTSQSNVTKRFEFSVEFTRLDEQVTFAYQVIVNAENDVETAILKAERKFKEDQPLIEIVSHADIADPEKRKDMVKQITFWRNRVNMSHAVYD